MKKFLVCLLLATTAVLVLSRSSLLHRFEQKMENTMTIRNMAAASVPKAVPKPSKDAAVRLLRKPQPKDQINWDVPFTAQAPTGNWDADHEEACEEASVLMVKRYFEGQPIKDADDADRAIKALIAENQTVLGLPPDQTAQQVAALLALEDRKLHISVVADPTEQSLKQALAEGNLVILPASGIDLKNPYFRQPGPTYHMLVLRGYTKDGFAITNDPGTKRGKEFLYPWQTLLSAIHDWNNGDTEHGDKAAIIVGLYLPFEANSSMRMNHLFIGHSMKIEN